MEEERKRILREIPAQLRSGASPQEVKKRFQRWLVGIAPEEIARVEQELIEEGIPREEIQCLCDVHPMVFKEQLERQEQPSELPIPIRILVEEHEMLLQISAKLL